jgi:DNA-directed RNA polymerase subunit RPC12/RpoP
MNKFRFHSGKNAGGVGHYTCCNCGNKLYLDNDQNLPQCPKCLNKTFVKDYVQIQLEDNKL